MKFPLKSQLIIAFIASLSLGLAPFNEPHLFGKIKWVMGGAKGMKTMDWFDLFLHSAPWIYLISLILIILFKKVKNKN